jgi:uncharacterized protein (TIGR00369 family)
VAAEEAGARGQAAWAEWRDMFASFPLHRMLGLTLEEERSGFSRIRLKTGPATLGGVGGSVHGGILAAMVDIAMLGAVRTTLAPDDRPAGTADLSISYLRPALGPYLDAEATVLKRGRQLIVLEVSIFDDQRRLCAKGRVLYALRAG